MVKNEFINADGSFNLIDSGIFVEDTFITGKKFWITPFERVYVTDYFGDPEVKLTILNQRSGNKFFLSKETLSYGEFIIEQSKVLSEKPYFYIGSDGKVYDRNKR